MRSSNSKDGAEDDVEATRDFMLRTQIATSKYLSELHKDDGELRKMHQLLTLVDVFVRASNSNSPNSNNAKTSRALGLSSEFLPPPPANRGDLTSKLTLIRIPDFSNPNPVSLFAKLDLW